MRWVGSICTVLRNRRYVLELAVSRFAALKGSGFGLYIVRCYVVMAWVQLYALCFQSSDVRD
jgi:hypothetical protein